MNLFLYSIIVYRTSFELANCEKNGSDRRVGVKIARGDKTAKRVTFARGDIFAREDNLARRHFFTTCHFSTSDNFAGVEI